MNCLVVDCQNSSSQNAAKVSFFAFPKDAELKEKWMQFCGRNNVNSITGGICHKHFKDEDIEENLTFEMGLKGKRYLKQGAIPCIKENIQKHENTAAQIVLDLNAPEELLSEIKIEPEEIHEPVYISPCTPKVLSGADFLSEQVEHMRKEINTLKRDNTLLQQKIRNRERKQQTEITNLKAKISNVNAETKNIEKKLLEIFTATQIQKLKSGEKKQMWTKEDITDAITLYKTAGPNCYKLLKKRKFPLPGIRTLQRYAPNKMKELSQNNCSISKNT